MGGRMAGMPPKPASVLRFIVALIGAPIAGLLTALLCSAIEMKVRSLIDAPTVIDSASIRAAAIVDRIIIPAFTLFCWLFVVPLAWVGRSRNLFAILGVTVIPLWTCGTILLHMPRLDSLFMSIAVVGVVVALPVFSAALTASAAFRLPFHFSLRTLLIATTLVHWCWG
jgi:hypothetical protein